MYELGKKDERTRIMDIIDELPESKIEKDYISKSKLFKNLTPHSLT
jgi:hypothetical protein